HIILGGGGSGHLQKPAQSSVMQPLKFAQGPEIFFTDPHQGLLEEILHHALRRGKSAPEGLGDHSRNQAVIAPQEFGPCVLIALKAQFHQLTIWELLPVHCAEYCSAKLYLTESSVAHISLWRWFIFSRGGGGYGDAAMLRSLG